MELLSNVLKVESECDNCDLDFFSNEHDGCGNVFANPMGKGWWMVFDLSTKKWEIQKRDHSKCIASLDVTHCPTCGKKLPM